MPPEMTPEARLRSGLQHLALPLTEVQVGQLIAYLALLTKWNRVYNLTAVRDPAEMVVKHLLDSLAIVPHVVGPRVLDVGSGGGLPGIPLAIARPELAVTLLDTNGKKTRFMTQAVTELGLSNGSVVHSRVEQFTPATPFDTITSRAFASLADFVTGSAHLLAPHGYLLAMKGARPEAELAALPSGWRYEVVLLAVPGLDALRHLVRLTQAQED